MRKVCRNGHIFEKRSSCPVCPICAKKVDAVMMKNHGMMIVGKDFISAVNLTIESADRNKPYIFEPGK